MQKELGTAFLIVETFYLRIGILAEELLEVEEEFLHIDAVVGVDVPGSLLHKCLLACLRQFTGNDFFVNGIGYP